VVNIDTDEFLIKFESNNINLGNGRIRNPKFTWNAPSYVLRTRLHANLISKMSQIQVEHWKVPRTIVVEGEILNDPIEIANYLREQEGVVYAEPNWKYKIDNVPNDPFFTDQQALISDQKGMINAPGAWDVQTGDPNRVVGILDTGIDWTHQDLVDNIWQNLAEDADGDGKVLEWDGLQWIFDPGDENGKDDDGNGYIDDFVGWDWSNNDNNPYDDHNHGTHVAGIIGAVGNNNIGVTGICWDVQLMALKCFDDKGSGRLSDILLAIEYSIKKDVKLTNNSWGGNYCASALYEMIKLADESGQLFLTSAGNGNSDIDTYDYLPATYALDNILTVMGSSPEDERPDSDFDASNYGTFAVDVAAPSMKVLSTVPNNQYGFKSGTSMAVPHVVGAAVLLWAENPGLSNTELKEEILCRAESTSSFEDICASGGRLDIGNMLNYENVVGISYDRSCTEPAIQFEASEPLAQASYIWSFGDGKMSEDAQPKHTYENMNKSYEVCVNVFDNCGKTFTACEIIDPSKCKTNHTSIGQKGLKRVYPNPFSDSFSVEYEIEKAGVTSISLYDLSGKLVEKLLQAPQEAGKHQYQFEVNQLPKSVYLLRLNTPDGQFSQKIYYL